MQEGIMVSFKSWAENRADRRSSDLRIRRRAEHRALGYVTNASLIVAVLCGVVAAWFHGGQISVSIAAFGAAVGLGGVIGFLFGVPGPRTAAAQPAAPAAKPQPTPPPGQTPMHQPPAVQPPAVQVIVAQPVVPPPEGQPPAAQAAQPAPPANANLNAPDPAAPPAPAPATPPATDPTVDPAAPPSRTSNLEQVADWVTKLILGGGLTQMQHIPPKIWQWAGIVAVGIAGGVPNLPGTHQAFAAGLLVYGFILGFFGGFLITKLQLGDTIWK
jgi:hypothetical protein